MKKQFNTFIADGSLLAVALVWGATFVIVKNAIETMPVYQFLVIRFTLAFILIALSCFKTLKNFTLKEIKIGVILGIFLFLGYAFQTVGLQYTSASKAGFITGMAVVLVPLISSAMFKETPHLAAIGGTILAFVGLSFLSLQGSLSLQLGDILVLLCAVSFAFHIIYVGKMTGQGRSSALALIQIGMVALLSLPFSIIVEGWPKINWSLDLMTALFITSFLATAMAFFLQTYMQRFTTATHTALIFSTEPVFAAVFAYFLTGEILTSKGVLGGVLILLGMLLSEIPTLLPYRQTEVREN